MNQEESNIILRANSGNIQDTSELVSFLYHLLRDELPAGIVEELIRKSRISPEGKAIIYTNGWLAKYAQDIASRLT